MPSIKISTAHQLYNVQCHWCRQDAVTFLGDLRWLEQDNYGTVTVICPYLQPRKMEYFNNVFNTFEILVKLTCEIIPVIIT